MRTAVLLVLLLLAPHVSGARSAVGDAVAFLSSLQGEDGGVLDPWLSSWTALAFAASRDDAWAHSRGGATLGDYLAARGAGYDERRIAPLEAARSVATVVALGADPRAFAGTDHVGRLLVHFDGRQFGSPGATNDDVWGIFAMRAAGYGPDAAPVRETATTLLAAQRPDGGWALTPASLSTTDETGWAIGALAVADRLRDPVGASALARGLDFLARHRDAQGAFAQCASSTCTPANAESTAAVVAGLRAAEALDDPRFSGAEAALAAFQRADGAFARTPGSDSWSFATPQAILALASNSGYPPARRFEASPVVPTEAVAGRAFVLAADAERCAWSVEDDRLEGCRVAPRVARAGSARVVLRAWSGDGGYVRETFSVAIVPAPPVAVLASPGEVAKRAAAAFDASGSADVEGGPLAFRFQFGDGASTPWQGSPWASHAYARSGAYRATVEARNAAGATASASRDLVVRNAPPTPVAEPVPACVPGDRVLLRGSAIDPDGDAVRLAWSWADGSEAGPVAERTAPAGEWTATLVAVDEEGASAETTLVAACGEARAPPPEARAAPRAVPPVLRATAPGEVASGAPVVVAGSVEDDAPGVTVAILVDGRPVPVRGGAGAFEAILFLPPGLHGIRARAVDADGLSSAEWTHEVEVTEETAPETPAEPPRAAPAGALQAALLAAWVGARARRAPRSRAREPR